MLHQDQDKPGFKPPEAYDLLADPATRVGTSPSAKLNGGGGSFAKGGPTPSGAVTDRERRLLPAERDRSSSLFDGCRAECSGV